MVHTLQYALRTLCMYIKYSEVCTCTQLCCHGYNLGMSSLIEAILKNQFLHVSFPDSGTWSDVKFSLEERKSEKK